MVTLMSKAFNSLTSMNTLSSYKTKCMTMLCHRYKVTIVKI